MGLGGGLQPTAIFSTIHAPASQRAIADVRGHVLLAWYLHVSVVWHGPPSVGGMEGHTRSPIRGGEPASPNPPAPAIEPIIGGCPGGFTMSAGDPALIGATTGAGFCVVLATELIDPPEAVGVSVAQLAAPATKVTTTDRLKSCLRLADFGMRPRGARDVPARPAQNANDLELPSLLPVAHMCHQHRQRLGGCTSNTPRPSTPLPLAASQLQ